MQVQPGRLGRQRESGQEQGARRGALVGQKNQSLPELPGQYHQRSGQGIRPRPLPRVQTHQNPQGVPHGKLTDQAYRHLLVGRRSARRHPLFDEICTEGAESADPGRNSLQQGKRRPLGQNSTAAGGHRQTIGRLCQNFTAFEQAAVRVC